MPLADLRLGSSSPSSSSRVRRGKESRTTKHVAIGVLTTVLEVTKEASPTFPPLQGVAGGILAIKDAIEKVSSNAYDIEALSKYVERLNSMIETSMPKDYESCPEALRKRIDVLSSDVDDILMGIRDLTSQNRITLLFTTEVTSGKIREYLRRLMWAIHTFIIGGTIAIEMGVDELHVALREGFEHMNVRFDGVEGQITGLAQQAQNLERRAELGDDYVPVPRYARSARFDSNSNRVICEENTRLETLATVYHWIKPGDPRLTELSVNLIQQPTDRRVLWLDGPAGTGKSTIAQTTAEWCDAVKYLGASFFCARDSNECSNVQLVFPTIAYQLGLHSSSFQEQVAGVLRADPDIQGSSISRQLQKLIVEPLLAVKSNGVFPACAVIIDALDECKDDEATSVILKALAHYVHDLDPLKFLITSRPVQHITGGFGMTELKNNTQQLTMNSISEEIMTRDIRQYLEKQLADVVQRYHIRRSWPSDDDMTALVHQANGLFIFAATAVKYIEDLRYSDPEAQLKTLLRSRLPTSATSPYQFLDALYTEVLHTAFPEIDRPLKARLKMVLGSIVLVQDRLPSSSLDVLLGLEHGTVRKTLRQLHSLVIVPESDNDPIRLIHPSFHDFLTDRSRCKDPNLVINPVIQHSILAQHCLQTLKNLRRDICEIGDSSKLNVEVPDLDSRVATHIPLHLQYACKHWTFHVANAEISEDIHELLKSFVAEHLLHWLEALSLLGDVGAAIEGLPIVRKLLQNLPLPTSDVPSLLYDCERMARQFYPSLSVSCLQVYFGVIPFCPTDTGLRKRYENKVPNLATVLSGSQRAWSPCSRVMEGHSDWVNAVAFSPNGEQIVSCSDDETLRLWDVKTGSHLQTLNGHFREVLSVAFSPSGHEIVSCSPSEIIIWDSVTGGLLDMCRMKTKGYIREFRVSIAWSPKGQFVGFGSGSLFSGNVIIWDVTRANRRLMQPLFFFSHPSELSCLVFSHDDSFVISCHMDGECAVRNLQDGSLTQSFSYKTAPSSVALSHDDKTVAYGYWDAIMLWNMGDGECFHKLTGHNIYSVDFSSDDQILVSVSSDNTIRLWSVSSGAQLVALIGHSDAIQSVRFSPDGNLVCSGSKDHTVRIWECKNMNPAVHQTPSNTSLIPWTRFRRRHNDSDDPRNWNGLTGSDHNHSDAVHVMVISGDNTVLAAGSRDGTIHLWDMSTGARIQTLSGHHEHVNRLALSPSGKQLVSTGYYSIRVWDVKTGRCVQVSKCNGYIMVIYAHDEHTVLSGSFDGCLQRWDTMAAKAHFSGEILYQNNGLISSISVSPNKRLVLFDTENIIKLLDMTMKTVLWTHELSDSVSSLSFSSDGSRMLSGTRDGHICLWDTALVLSPEGNNALLEEFHADNSHVPVSFSIDQKSIVSSTSFHLIAAREHWPHCASLNDERSPKTPPVFLLFINKDWIWRAGPGGQRRICWVPPEYRYVGPDFFRQSQESFMAVSASKFVLKTDSGSLVVLVDLSNCARIPELL